MRFEIVLSFLSTFQIYHQSLSNNLAVLEFGYTTEQLSLISAVFPVGKFIGTISIILLFKKEFSNRQCLDCAAIFLIIGAFVMFVPSFFLLCASRLTLGIGVGIAFISAFLALNDFSECNEQDQKLYNDVQTSKEQCQTRQLSAFFSTAILFAAATFFANLSSFLHFSSHFAQISIYAIPAILSGLNYFWHRNLIDKQLLSINCDSNLERSITNSNSKKKIKDDSISGNKMPFNLENSNESANHLLITLDKRPFIINEKVPSLKWKNNSFLMAMILMSLNATIGVPIILAFSSIIYRSLDNSANGSMLLSAGFPLVQLCIMCTFCYWTKSSVNDFFTKRSILFIGYLICLISMFLLLLTLKAGTLETDPTAKRIFASFWFTLLAVATAPPCNAGIAIITTELFSTRSELIQGMAISRSFFWIFSSILCGLFLHILESGSLFLALLPCFLASVVGFVLLVIYLPKSINGKRCNNETLHFKNCLEYGGVASTPTSLANSSLDSFY